MLTSLPGPIARAGLAGGAALPVALAGRAEEAPPGLVAVASRLAPALAGAVPAAVARLSDEVVKGMFLSKLKLFPLAALTVVLGPAGASLGSGGPRAVAPLVAHAPPPRERAAREWRLEKSWVAEKAVLSAVMFAPDGKKLYSSVQLTTVQRVGNAVQTVSFQEFTEWGLSPGGREFKFRDRDCPDLLSVGHSPDRKRWAFGGKDHRLVVRDRVDGPAVMSVDAQAKVWAVAVAPDGGWVVTGGDDNLARVWDVKPGKERKPLAGHTAPVQAAAVSPDGKTIATGGEDGTLRLWDAATGKRLHTFDGSVLPGCGSPLSADGSLTAGYAPRPDGKGYGIAVWDVTTGKSAGFLATKLRAFRQVAFSPDGKRLAVSGTNEAEEGVLEVWVMK